MTTFNLRAYKEAKIMLPQLESILKIMNLSIAGFKLFKGFIPVAVVLSTLNEQKVVIEIHRDRFKRIVDNKGMR